MIGERNYDGSDDMTATQASERELRARILRRKQAMDLAFRLVRRGIVDAAAVDDPDGYDVGKTMDAIRDLSDELFICGWVAAWQSQDVVGHMHGYVAMPGRLKSL